MTPAQQIEAELEQYRHRIIPRLKEMIRTYEHQLAEERTRTRRLELMLKQVQANQRPSARQAPARGPAASSTLAAPQKRLVQYLQQGQRNFLDVRNQAIASAALSFLIQHTLVQLYAADAEQEAVRARAMYSNLYTLSSKLQRYQGTPLQGFEAARAELEKIAGIEAFADGLERSAAQHTDEKLFRSYLKHLRDHAWLDLTPYFYDVDADGRVFGLG